MKALISPQTLAAAFDLLARITDVELAPLAFVASIVLVIVLGFCIAAAMERRRRAALQAVADRLGLSFDSTAGMVMTMPFATLPLFLSGHGRRAENLISGVAGREGVVSAPMTAGGGGSRLMRGDESSAAQILVFDYRYSTGGGKNHKTHRQTVAAVRLTAGDLPRFSLWPESFLLQVAAALGYQDIDIESSPSFSRKWLLRGLSESEIRSFFGPQLVDALENIEPRCIEAHGEWLIVYRTRRRVSPERIGEFLEEARQTGQTFAAHAARGRNRSVNGDPLDGATR